MRLLAGVTCASLLLCVVASPSQAEKRVALVIGNAAYRSMPRLTNPKNDAEDVGKALRALQFETVVATDLNRTGMNDALDRFTRTVDGADIAIVYYSGHGMQFAGANYLLPVEARLDSAADVNRFRLMPVDDVLDALKSVRGARVLVLDACRNNPVEEDLKRQLVSMPGANRDAVLTRGLVRTSAGNGLLVAYATQANDVASDGTARNSPFTAAFVRHVGTPDLDLRQMLFRVQDDVARATAGRQRPELSISLIGEFKLKVAAASPVAEAPKPSMVQSPTVDPAERAGTLTRDTTSVAVLEDFIRQFGNTAYGSMARARLEELKKSQTVAAAQSSQPPAPAQSGSGGILSGITDWFTKPSPPAPTAPPSQPNTTVATVAPPVTPASPVTPAQPAVGVFLSPLSPEHERALKPKDMFKECGKCPVVVVIPAGSFTMGSPANEEGRADYEERQHEVTIPKPFAVGRSAVTFDEWDACVADGGCNGYRPSDEGWGRGQRPVINVSWTDAKAYVTWISRKTGKAYRLLSEAEREYATRAGTKTPFWWGSSISASRANYYSNTSYGGGPKSEYRGHTLPVDSFEPNPFGLYQMHGNVSEWVEDCMPDSHFKFPSDGSAGKFGNCRDRFLHGGSWGNEPKELRSGSRSGKSASERNAYVGFRVVRTLAP